MARPGYRLFAAASWGLIFVAVIHTIGHFAGRPTDPAEIKAFDAMASYRLEFPLGMRPTILDVFRDLSLTMAITLAGLGLQNVVVSSLAGATPLLMRRLAGTTSLVLGVRWVCKCSIGSHLRWCLSLWSRCYTSSPGCACAPARPPSWVQPNRRVGSS